MAQNGITLLVNGVERRLAVDPRRRLLDVLREDLGLTGTKEGCGQGHCGACSILVDGALANACLTQVGKVAGKQVTTIEGLGSPQSPHPLQEAFVQAGAVQCGFCTPGMIMAAKALLDKNGDPSPNDVVQGLSKNLCRCTGYVKIVEAVLLAAALVRGERPPMQEVGEGVGARRVNRWEGLERATGRALYANDLARQGMLYVQALRSPHHHARIVSLDTTEAGKSPGVEAVLTARDVPFNRLGMIFTKDQPLLAEDEVRYLGEPVAAVVATSPSLARQALSLIKIDYQVLPHVADALEAMSPGAPPVHPQGNVAGRRRIVKGNVDQGFQEADVIVEASYSTPFNEHAYLEPEAGLSYLDEEGRITICAPSQNIHDDQRAVASLLGLDPKRVRVMQTPTGGGFGGKIELSVQGVLALATHRLGKPVKWVYSRQESIQATGKRHPFHIKLRTGATKEGILTALQAELVANTGAYTGVGPGVLTRAAIHITGPYRVPNVLIEGTLVFTNSPSCCAMRGFGAPQACFAIESQMDLLAARLGLDPLELRWRNAMDRGSETATGQVLWESVGLKQTLEAIRPFYQEALASLGDQAKGGPSPVRKGIGLACMWFGIGKTGAPNPSTVHIELGRDGRIRLFTGAADIGQGLRTALTQIACQELGLPFEALMTIELDTAISPEADATCASRQTYFTGNAVKRAAARLKSALVEAASRAWEERPEDLAFQKEHLVSRANPSFRAPLAEVAAVCQEAGIPLRYEAAWDHNPTPLDPQTGQGVPWQTYAFGTQLAEVEVNTSTGEVRVRRIVAAHDVGKAINPLNVEGQIEGGSLMGLGFALKEEFVPGKTHNLGHYIIPRTTDMPQVLPIIVEAAEPTGPFGAKGIGEAATCATGPAIINAIDQACGVRIFHLPATPDRVLGGSSPEAM